MPQNLTSAPRSCQNSIVGGGRFRPALETTMNFKVTVLCPDNFTVRQAQDFIHMTSKWVVGCTVLPNRILLLQSNDREALTAAALFGDGGIVILR
jgi:hypothetical protein